MTEPITQHQVEQQMSREAERLRGLVDDLASAGRNAATTEASFKAGFAQARLLARTKAEKMTEAKADDLATVETSQKRLEALIAANHLTTVRESLRASQAILSGLQSLLASIVRVT
jgi:hypothetical protein